MSIDKIRVVGVAEIGESRRNELRAAQAERPDREARPEKARAAEAQKLEPAASDESIYLKRLNTELRFEADSQLKEVLVKIVDPETNEVIRQIPSEEMISIRKRMEELMRILGKNGSGPDGRSL